MGVAEEEMIMKMLTIVCREYFDDNVLLLFNRLGIKGYTLISGVGGRGKTGAVSGKHSTTDRNMMFLTVLDDAQMATLLTAFKELQATLVKEHHGLEIPIKAFLQPCEMIL